MDVGGASIQGASLKLNMMISTPGTMGRVWKNLLVFAGRVSRAFAAPPVDVDAAPVAV